MPGHRHLQNTIASLSDDQVRNALALLPEEFQAAGRRHEAFFRDQLATAIVANAAATDSTPIDVLVLTLDLL